MGIIAKLVETSKGFFLKQEIVTPKVVQPFRRKVYIVQRRKNDEWHMYGAPQGSQEEAVSALVDWQAWFPNEEFRVHFIYK